MIWQRKQRYPVDTVSMLLMHLHSRITLKMQLIYIFLSTAKSKHTFCGFDAQKRRMLRKLIFFCSVIEWKKSILFQGNAAVHVSQMCGKEMRKFSDSKSKKTLLKAKNCVVSPWEWKRKNGKMQSFNKLIQQFSFSSIDGQFSQAYDQGRSTNCT